MRHRKIHDPADVIAGIIAGTIGIGVIVAPMLPDRFFGFMGMIIIPVILVAAWCGWAVLTTLFSGLR